MKMKLNFVPDKPTVNGRIYEMEDLQKIFDIADIPITSFPSKTGAVNIKDIIGFANLSEINPDIIEFDIKQVKSGMLDIVKNNDLTIMAFGNVNEEKKIVKDLKLLHLYIVY